MSASNCMLEPREGFRQLEKAATFRYPQGREVAMLLSELNVPIKEIKSKIYETWRRL